MYAQPDVSLNVLREQPVEFVEEMAGFYFRSIMLESEGDAIPQHMHAYDHATLVCSGRARLWVDGEWIRDIEAGHAVEVKANKSHVFQALSPKTMLSCIHNVESADSIRAKES